MAISWGAIKSTLLFFGPILLPKAIGYYRALRAAPTIHGLSVRPVPREVLHALMILAITGLLFLIQTLPYFSPEDVFSLTRSRLQIPTDVLFTRLSTLRASGLTKADTLLRSKISSLDSRLLYLQHGPATITDCTFCTPEDPNSYLYYSLSAVLSPHLFNLIILGIVTCSVFTGRHGSVWRTQANIAALGVVLLDVYLVCSYSHQKNARATRLEEIDFFFWTSRFYRFLCLATLDGMCGYILYLSSTNRAFLNPPTASERTETLTRCLDNTRSKISAVSILHNTIVRDADLRNRSSLYWVREGRITMEMMEHREVMEGINNALENRIDIGTIAREADSYSESILLPFQERIELDTHT